MPGGNINHALNYSALRGGIAIHNPLSDPAVPGSSFGTIGFIGTSDGADRWVVSCYHVLCRKDADFPAQSTEPIFHPQSPMMQGPVAFVSSEKANRQLDCAAARVLVPGSAFGHILGIGKLSAPVDPAIGMRVIKSGAQTGVTEGIVVDVRNTEVDIAPIGYPPGYELTEGGDSGSLWVDAATMSPVAMHFRGNERNKPELAIGKKILEVLNTLQLQIVSD